MRGREAIMHVLQGGPSTRLPRAIFGGGRWAYQQAGLRTEDLDQAPDRFADALAGIFGSLDTDIVFAGSGLNTFPAEAIGGELSFREGQAPLLAHPLIRKTEDARFFEGIDIDDSPRSLALIAMISRLRRLLPDRFLCATSWGPFTWGMILCDWNLLQEKTATDREFIREVCELGVRISSSFFAPLVDQGLVDGIVISDGAATLIPLDLYKDTVLPCERKLFELFRNRRVSRFLHQCGNIRSQFALYPETGADCISLDAGVSLAEVSAHYGPRLTVGGNVDVIKTVFGGTSEQICDAVAECTAGLSRPFQRFILMPSCDLPPDTSFANVRAFLACADQVL